MMSRFNVKRDRSGISQVESGLDSLFSETYSAYDSYSFSFDGPPSNLGTISDDAITTSDEDLTYPGFDQYVDQYLENDPLRGAVSYFTSYSTSDDEGDGDDDNTSEPFENLQLQGSLLVLDKKREADIASKLSAITPSEYSSVPRKPESIPQMQTSQSVGAQDMTKDTKAALATNFEEKATKSKSAMARSIFPRRSRSVESASEPKEGVKEAWAHILLRKKDTDLPSTGTAAKVKDDHLKIPDQLRMPSDAMKGSTATDRAAETSPYGVLHQQNSEEENEIVFGVESDGEEEQPRTLWNSISLWERKGGHEEKEKAPATPLLTKRRSRRRNLFSPDNKETRRESLLSSKSDQAMSQTYKKLSVVSPFSSKSSKRAVLSPRNQKDESVSKPPRIMSAPMSPKIKAAPASPMKKKEPSEAKRQGHFLSPGVRVVKKKATSPPLAELSIKTSSSLPSPLSDRHQKPTTSASHGRTTGLPGVMSDEGSKSAIPSKTETQEEGAQKLRGTTSPKLTQVNSYFHDKIRRIRGEETDSFTEGIEIIRDDENELVQDKNAKEKMLESILYHPSESVKSSLLGKKKRVRWISPKKTDSGLDSKKNVTSDSKQIEEKEDTEAEPDNSFPEQNETMCSHSVIEQALGLYDSEGNKVDLLYPCTTLTITDKADEPDTAKKTMEVTDKADEPDTAQKTMEAEKTSRNKCTDETAGMKFKERQKAVTTLGSSSSQASGYEVVCARKKNPSLNVKTTMDQTDGPKRRKAIEERILRSPLRFLGLASPKGAERDSDLALRRTRPLSAKKRDDSKAREKTRALKRFRSEDDILFPRPPLHPNSDRGAAHKALGEYALDNDESQSQTSNSILAEPNQTITTQQCCTAEHLLRQIVIETNREIMPGSGSLESKPVVLYPILDFNPCYDEFILSSDLDDITFNPLAKIPDSKRIKQLKNDQKDDTARDTPKSDQKEDKSMNTSKIDKKEETNALFKEVLVDEMNEEFMGIEVAHASKRRNRLTSTGKKWFDQAVRPLSSLKRLPQPSETRDHETERRKKEKKHKKELQQNAYQKQDSASVERAKPEAQGNSQELVPIGSLENKTREDSRSTKLHVGDRCDRLCAAATLHASPPTCPAFDYKLGTSRRLPTAGKDVATEKKPDIEGEGQSSKESKSNVNETVVQGTPAKKEMALESPSQGKTKTFLERFKKRQRNNESDAPANTHPTSRGQKTKNTMDEEIDKIVYSATANRPPRTPESMVTLGSQRYVVTDRIDRLCGSILVSPKCALLDFEENESDLQLLSPLEGLPMNFATTDIGDKPSNESKTVLEDDDAAKAISQEAPRVKGRLWVGPFRKRRDKDDKPSDKDDHGQSTEKLSEKQARLQTKTRINVSRRTKENMKDTSGRPKQNGEEDRRVNEVTASRSNEKKKKRRRTTASVKKQGTSQKTLMEAKEKKKKKEQKSTVTPSEYEVPSEDSEGDEASKRLKDLEDKLAKRLEFDRKLLEAVQKRKSKGKKRKQKRRSNLDAKIDSTSVGATYLEAFEAISCQPRDIKKKKTKKKPPSMPTGRETFSAFAEGLASFFSCSGDTT